jgi:hypothetical protein
MSFFWVRMLLIRLDNAKRVHAEDFRGTGDVSEDFESHSAISWSLRIGRDPVGL